MRLEELGYKPRKVPDYIRINCYDENKFTKSEVNALIDLANIYNIKTFTLHKKYAMFYDADNEDENVIFNKNN